MIVFENGYHNSKGVCYVCGNKVSLETHHIIPVSLGGEKGPLVDLCNNCHYTVHKTASSKTPSNDKKINTLAAVIVTYEKRVGKKDKTSAFSTRFTSETNTKILKLANLFNTSKRNIIVMAIHALYSKHF